MPSKRLVLFFFCPSTSLENPVETTICTTTSTTPFERELALEKSMIDRGRDRYFKTVARCREQELESSTSYGKIMMKRGIEPLAAAIDAFLTDARSGAAGRRHKAVAVLEGMDTNVVAFLTLRKVMDTFSKKVLLQTVAIGVGREIELEKKLAVLEEQDKDRYKMTQNHIKNSKARKHRRTVLQFAFGKSETTEYEGMLDQDLFHVGQKLIELMVNATGLFVITLEPYKKVANGLASSAYVLEPTTVCREWLNKHTEQVSIMAPDFIPTIIPPKAWTGAFTGGYHSALPYPLVLVKTKNRDYLNVLNQRIQNGEMQEVLRAVNALQNTGWSIKQEVFSILSHLWDTTEGGMASLPPRDGYRLPLCPVCGADLTDSTSARVRHACLDTLAEDDFKAWKKQAAMIRERNVSTFSQRLQLAKILSMAERYAEEECFYFPYQLDFRGRIYAVPPFLNPQGTDFAKGVLQFAEGKELGSMSAVRWLAIHGANTFGNDKVSLDERHSWVLENQERILAVAADPLGETWWMDVDSPWCFLAFCFEWAGYVREGLSFKSRLPIAMDGTCNGLQIFSLLLRDKVGGTAVNLLPSERPNDIYRIVADKVLARLQEDSQDENLNYMVMSKDKSKALYNPYTCANILKNAGINRKTTKRQVMVLPYGGTESSCREYTEEWLKGQIQDEKLHLPEGQKVYGMSMYLAKHIWEAIGTTVIAARDAMKFLQDMATVVNRVNKPIQWTTPCGLPVLQGYKDTKEQRIKTRIGDQIVKFSIQETASDATLNTAKQRSAISPNYVHSLDAAALMKTVCFCLDNDIAAFAMIHDSYGTYAADSEKLASLLRSTFIKMFGGDANLLSEFQKEVLACVPLEEQTKLPALPKTGELEVREVEKSAFFFA